MIPMVSYYWMVTILLLTTSPKATIYGSIVVFASIFLTFNPQNLQELIGKMGVGWGFKMESKKLSRFQIFLPTPPSLISPSINPWSLRPLWEHHPKGLTGITWFEKKLIWISARARSLDPLALLRHPTNQGRLQVWKSLWQLIAIEMIHLVDPG